MSHRVSFNKTPRIIQEDAHGLYIIVKDYVYRPTINGWTQRDERFPNGNLILGTQWPLGEPLRVFKSSFEDIREIEENSWLVEENFDKNRGATNSRGFRIGFGPFGAMEGAYIALNGISYNNGVKDPDLCNTDEAWILHGKKIKGNVQPFQNTKFHVIDIVQMQKEANAFDLKWGNMDKKYRIKLDIMCEEQGLPYK